MRGWACASVISFEGAVGIIAHDDPLHLGLPALFEGSVRAAPASDRMLAGGLTESLKSDRSEIRADGSPRSLHRNGQRRVMQTVHDKATVEHDFRFKLIS